MTYTTIEEYLAGLVEKKAWTPEMNTVEKLLKKAMEDGFTEMAIELPYFGQSRTIIRKNKKVNTDYLTDSSEVDLERFYAITQLIPHIEPHNLI